MYYDGYEQLKDALLTMDRLLDEIAKEVEKEEDKKGGVTHEEN